MMQLGPHDKQALGDWVDIPKGEQKDSARGQQLLCVHYAADKETTAGEVKIMVLAAAVETILIFGDKRFSSAKLRQLTPHKEWLSAVALSQRYDAGGESQSFAWPSAGVRLEKDGNDSVSQSCKWQPMLGSADTVWCYGLVRFRHLTSTK